MFPADIHHSSLHCKAARTSAGRKEEYGKLKFTLKSQCLDSWPQSLDGMCTEPMHKKNNNIARLDCKNCVYEHVTSCFVLQGQTRVRRTGSTLCPEDREALSSTQFVWLQQISKSLSSVASGPFPFFVTRFLVSRTRSCQISH